MKFTFAWLKDHLDTTAPLDAITAKLASIGLEVEGVEDRGARLAAFTLARVVDAKQHPNADRLRVAQVEIAKGQPPVEVVCGAPNCRTGMIGVFAPLGTLIPGTGLTLEKKPVRGVVSNGMLCSERELELSDEHDGIIELDQSLAGRIGERYVDVMGLGDPVIEVKLTPNRPDCTGVRGIARDLAAAGLGKLKPEPQLGKIEGDYDCPVPIRLSFPPGEEHACSCFAGRVIQGIRNGPSPAWLQGRLKAIGQRPINAVVDITNYIQFDRGRPLHVYDANKINGGITARFARPGEKFLALDNKEYVCDGEMTVIADDGGHVHLGGIIGSYDTGSTEATTNVFIECAFFDPLRTAATGRRAGVQTDARYRFERGVDPAYVRPGLDLATSMMLEIVGGKPSKARVAGAPPSARTVIAFDFGHVPKLAGLDVKEADARRILEALGFAIEGKGPAVKVTAPSWRPDVHGAADLVEEVARIVGLETVPPAAMPRARGVTGMVLTETQRRARRVRRLLAARGFTEAVIWSFIPQPQAEHFGGGEAALELDNPISSEMTTMRPSLLPGLLTAAQRNRNRGFREVALFELGQVYRGDRPEDQLLIAGGVRDGAALTSGHGRHWDGSAADAGFFDVKADVVAALSALGIDASKAQMTRDAPGWYHPGRSATLRLGPKTVLAQLGEVHPETLRMLDVAGPVAAFEIFLDALPAEKRKTSKARPALVAQDLPAVRRDFAFVVDDAVAAGDLIKAAVGAERALITGATVFDVFTGASVGTGKKSIAIEVTIQPREKTLTDPEIEAVAGKIVAEVARATGGVIRG